MDNIKDFLETLTYVTAITLGILEIYDRFKGKGK